MNRLKSFRNSHRRCSVRKDVLGNFAKFTGNHACQNPFFNTVAGLRSLLLVFELKYELNPLFMWSFFNKWDSKSLKVQKYSELARYSHNKIRNKFTKLQRCNVVEYDTKKYKPFKPGVRFWEKVVSYILFY